MKFLLKLLCKVLPMYAQCPVCLRHFVWKSFDGCRHCRNKHDVHQWSIHRNTASMSIALGTVPDFGLKTTSRSVVNGSWDVVDCHVFFNDIHVVGHYTYRYHSEYIAANVFTQFVRDGQPYALRATDYTSIEVMRLPSCEKVGGLEPDAFGRCPTSIAIPKGQRDIAIVAGCVWGDDSQHWLYVLDIRLAHKGILRYANELLDYGVIFAPDYVDNVAELIEGEPMRGQRFTLTGVEYAENPEYSAADEDAAEEAGEYYDVEPWTEASKSIELDLRKLKPLETDDG